ncbi:MAG: ATP-binding protein, partial [Nanoarchaeota archaeon]
MSVYPFNLDDWSEYVIKTLVDEKIEEDHYLDYKEKFDFTNKKYKQKMCNIMTSFANSKGGFLVFGIEDKQKTLKGIDFEGEINLKISEVIQNCMPQVHFDTKPLEVEGKKVVVCQVYESEDKPIQSSDSAFYIRLSGKTEPLSRDLLSELFITRNQKEYHKKKLIAEIENFISVMEEFENEKGRPTFPKFYALRLTEFEKAVSDYALYLNEYIQDIIKIIQKRIMEIKRLENFFNMGLDINLKQRWGSSWTDLESFMDTAKTKKYLTTYNTKVSENCGLIINNLELLKKHLNGDLVEG